MFGKIVKNTCFSERIELALPIQDWCNMDETRWEQWVNFIFLVKIMYTIDDLLLRGYADDTEKRMGVPDLNLMGTMGIKQLGC